MLKPHLILSICRSNAHIHSNMIATYLPSFAKAFSISLVGLILGNSNLVADTVAYWNFNSLSIATASAASATGATGIAAISISSISCGSGRSATCTV